jgi:hypothetical protein
MRFIMMVKSAERSVPPRKELLDATAQLAAEAMKAGEMIETGGLGPTVASFTRPAGGRKDCRNRRAIHRSQGSLRRLCDF